MSDLRVAAGALAPPSLARPQAGEAANPVARFADVMKAVVGEANSDQLSAQKAATELVAGKTDIVDTVLALNKAELSLRMVVELRNRLLGAWQEISHVGR